MAELRATPMSNPIMGLLADRLKKVQQFGAKPFGYENPPVEMLMNLLGVPVVQQTMERMAYGEPLTTGSGMTTKPRPEAIEAAMTLLPASAGLAKATKGMPVGASIKNVSQQGLLDIAKRDASDIFGEGAQRIKYTDPRSGGSIDVLARPDNTASVLSLEVPETFRGQGIGGLLQSRVLQDFPDMQGQVSSKAAATTAYRLGRRPPNMPDATLEDVYKMIDENSSVNLVSPQMQQRIAPTPETGLLGQEVTEYRGSHTAPNAQVYGATLDNLTGIMPKDVYTVTGKNLYGIGDSAIDSEWWRAAMKVKGNPNAEVEVYRAVPKGVKNINSGDWVTTSPTYAKWHGENVLDGEYEIIKQKVKANTLSTEGYPYEFGYNE